LLKLHAINSSLASTHNSAKLALSALGECSASMGLNLDVAQAVLEMPSIQNPSWKTTLDSAWTQIEDAYLSGEMFRLGLANPSFVTLLKPDGTTAFGGNQGWFPDAIISKFGCGTVAFADPLIYLQSKNGAKNVPTTQGDFDIFVIDVLLEKTRTQKSNQEN
jgi:hypothetical protein